MTATNRSVQYRNLDAGNPHVRFDDGKVVPCTAEAALRREFRRSVVLVGLCVAGALGASAAFDSETLAFYPFDEGTVGEFQANQYNAVDRDLFVGAACKNPDNTANSTTRMSDETPGKYIYAGNRTPDCLVYTNPRSLRLGSGTFYSDKTKSTYGYLEIPSVALELSKHHATGCTVEFFFKMDSEDGWYPNSYQVGFYAGYLVNGTVGATFKTLLPTALARPYETRLVINSTSTGPNNKDVVAATDLRNKISNFTAVNDGKWHHYAFVVDPEAGTLRYYIDKVLIGSNTTNSLAVTTKELSSGGYFNIGRVGGNEYSFGAAISCLRFSKSARSVEEFLVASDEVSLPEGMVAAYSFDDGAVGASAAGSATLKNAVNGLTHKGTVTLSTASGANATATFDTDVPAPYVFSGKRTASSVPIYANPQSVKITSDLVGNSAEITMAQLGTAISKLHDVGYTLEYFVKYLDENQGNFPPAFVSYVCGYPAEFRLYMPAATSGTVAKMLVYSIGSRETYGATLYSTSLPFDYLTDQAWHHVAIVAQPKNADTGKVELSVWVDGTKYGKITIASAAEVTASNVLRLGRGSNYHVKLACVTLSKGAKTADKFLRGYRTKAQPGLVVVFR